MKVGMYYNNRDVRVEEKPIPEVGDNDLLIKVMASGICGSDLMEWYRLKKAPLVLGHEIAGEVVDVGKKVEKYQKGDRVFATHHVPCNECRLCLKGHETACETFHTKNYFSPGGFSEYLRVSGKSVETGMLKLPDEMTYEQGTFIEPLGTVVRCFRKAEFRRGESVLVIGAGVAGLLNICLAKALGAGNIIATDLNKYRLDAAKKSGASYALSATEATPGSIQSVNHGCLVDKVILCTSSKFAAEQALDSVGKGGTIMFFAVPRPGEMPEIDLNNYWRDDVSLKTAYGAAPSDNLEAMELIWGKKVCVDDLITHRLPLEKIADGFCLAAEGKDCLKVMIQPHQADIF